ncbi:MAG: hypothetical protein LLF94_04465, partial [Chlamydiales bacterium]|nr:hypothetical protein [Chlamydiales bacterium]
PTATVIDMNKIYSNIGPHVVSQGAIQASFASINPETHVDSLSNTARSLFESIGNSTLASWISSGLNKAASALEILMILPYGKQVTASFLEQGGLPIYEIEKTFAQLPNLITEHAVNAEGKVLEAISWVDKQMDLSHKASVVVEHNATLTELANKTQKHFQTLSDAVVKDCVDKGFKYICKEDVYEILKSPENILQYAQKLKLDPNSQEFLAAIQEMATTSVIVEAIEVAGDKAEEVAQQTASSWSAWFTQGLEAFGQTRFGKGIDHLKKAVAPTANSLVNSVSNTAKSVKGLFTSGQKLPPKVQEEMAKWQETAVNYAKTKAKLDASTLSEAAILEIGGLWGTLLQQASSNDPFSKFLREMYINNVQPALQKALGALDAVHNINAANHNFLSVQMDAHLQTELQMQQFLSEKAKIAHKTHADESLTTLNQAMSGLASWGFPILSWLFLSSQTLTVLPFILQRIVPHVMRSTASCIQNSSKPFWYFLAENSKHVLNKGAFFVKNSSTTAGSWLQKTYNQQLDSGYIDPARIANFKALSPEEQKYLIDKTHAPKLGYEEQIKHVLKALDSMSMPTKALSTLSLSEYFQLPTDQQEDILFTVAHSKGYKHFLDKDTDRIVAAYNELGNDLTAAQYNKMTHSDKERVRLAVATHSHQKHWKYQMALESPMGWELDAFRALTHTTNHRLKNILELYAHLEGPEKAICTPAKIRAMTVPQQEHLLEIIDTYHPEYADGFKARFGLDMYTFFSTQHAQEKEQLYAALASLYNSLPPGQQAKLLELTPRELEYMSQEEKRQITLFLMHTKNMPEGGDIISTFNSLERLQQAEFRESKELAAVQKEAVVATLEKEISEATLKLKALQRRITRLTDGEYLAAKEQQATQERARDALIKDKDAKSMMLESMREAKASYRVQQRAKSTLYAVTKELAVVEKQLELDTQKQTMLADKLARLHELEQEYIQKLTSLNALLGTNIDADDTCQESPKISKAIDATLTNTLNEVGKSMIQSLYAVIADKTKGKSREQAVKFSREFLDMAIALRQKHVTAVLARIKSLKSEIAHLAQQKAYDALAEKRLQLRAHTNFTLKLNQALLAKFQLLREEFETHIPPNTTLAAPAA